MTGILAGQVHVYFSPLVASIEHIKGGKLRALAVTSAMRSEALPDIPVKARLADAGGVVLTARPRLR